jgi:DNA repair protein RecO (recombination protein O)
MALLTTDALVLQSFPYGETSRIVRLLTRAAGVHTAIAKGAARPRSRYHVLEPFAEGSAALYIRPTRELQTLASFDVTRSRHELGRDLLRFGGASLLAELVLRTASEEAQPDLFEVIAQGLDRVACVDAAALEVAVLAATWRAIAVLGFTPELDVCIVCSREIAARDDASFDYAAGGLRCDACAAGLPGRRVPGRARNALRAFCRGEAVRVDITTGHWRLLARYLEHHLLEGAQLRSLHFVATSLSVR